MPTDQKDDDSPEIGQILGGSVCVCRGDDSPDEWIDWLEPLASEYRELLDFAESNGVRPSFEDSSIAPSNIIDFCGAIGVDLRSSFWEGSCVSGIYRAGWVPTGNKRAVAAEAQRLINRLRKALEATVRDRIIDELRGIDDLEELIASSSDHRGQFRTEVVALRADLAAQHAAARDAQRALQEVLEADSRVIDQACLRVACAVIERRRERIIAGPLVLWDDGVVYAITAIGRTVLPADSSPAVLLESLRRIKHPVVSIVDNTVIGGWTSGPIYRNGPATTNGWIDIWKQRYSKRPVFIVDPPSARDAAYEIYDALSR